MTRVLDTAGPGNHSALAPPNSDYVNVYAMDGSTAQTVTWPAGMTFCNINGSANYWTKTGGTAAIPSGGLTDGSGSALNVGARKKYSGETTFSIISATSQYITIEFWSA